MADAPCGARLKSLLLYQEPFKGSGWSFLWKQFLALRAIQILYVADSSLWLWQKRRSQKNVVTFESTPDFQFFNSENGITTIAGSLWHPSRGAGFSGRRNRGYRL